jgi:hypothetical protein
MTGRPVSVQAVTGTITMDFGGLFSDAWRLVRRSPLLLGLGLVSGIGSGAVSVARIWLTANLSDLTAETGSRSGLSGILSSFFDSPLPELRAQLIWGALGFFVLVLGIWMVALFIDGAQIRAVIKLSAGEPVTLPQALLDARRYVTRFIGIDTIIFLPLFLLTVLILALVLGILVGALTLAFSNAPANVGIVILAFATICLLPAMCLVLPVGLLTSVLRTFSFRDLVLRNAGVRDSIRHTWTVIKANVGRVFILVALVWGLRTSVSLLLSLGTLPVIGVFTATAFMTTGESTSQVSGEIARWAVASGTIGLTMVVNGFIAALCATVWTLGYLELASAADSES